MFAAIHLPRPLLQSQLREHPGRRYQPVAVLDEAGRLTTSNRERGKLRVMEASGEAEEFGVQRGMTASQAQARCDDLVLFNRSSRSENCLTDLLLEVAEQFTPDFEDTEFGTCLLDLGGITAWEREAFPMARQIHERLLDHDLRCLVGMAENPDLAFLAAKACDYYSEQDTPLLILRAKNLEEFLHPLPVEVLDPEPALSEILELWGIRTIGEFVAPGRDRLVERLGEEVGRLRDRACGKSHRLLRLVRPVETYRATMDLEYEVATLEPLNEILGRLLATIVARLRGAYLVAERLRLTLNLVGGGCYRRTFRLPEPGNHVEQLLRMLWVHLETFEVQAPINGVSLEAIPSRGGQHQFDLFAAGVRDPNRLSETLTRVEAILGSERFGVPELNPTHHPDSFKMLPFQPEKEPQVIENPLSLQMVRLPMKRYRPRRHVRVLLSLPDSASPGRDPSLNRGPTGGASGSDATGNASRALASPEAILGGDFKGRILQARGPFAASGDWWEKRTYWKREEWDVRHENGNFYRLVRDKGEWFVEGRG